jgi:predicted amidohydrolase
MPLARQALHDAGEDIHVALWPTVHERHQLASRHYAFEGRCFVLAAGSVMRASSLPPELEVEKSRLAPGSGLVLRGGSAIIGPDAEYIVPPLWDRPGILVADLDLDRVRREMTWTSGALQPARLFSMTGGAVAAPVADAPFLPCSPAGPHDHPSWPP